MGKSQETYGKKEKEKKRLKKRLEKQEKREKRKGNVKEGGLESMMAYVDENGQITDVPPDPSKKKSINADTIEIGIPKKEKEEMNTVRTGKIDFFDHGKGFGFIRELDTQEKYFVHVNGLTEEVQENDKVSFELEKGLKGLNAVRVKKI